MPKRWPSKQVVCKVLSASLAFSSLVLLVGTPLIYYTTGLRDFSHRLNQLDERALLSTIPEEERVDGEVFVIDCSCAVYLILDVDVDERYFANQTWWSSDYPQVIVETIDYIETTQPRWLVVRKLTVADGTLGDALEGYSLQSEESERFFIYRLS